jgi:hypothetical protein
VLYRSNLETHSLEDVATLPDKFNLITGWEISGDQKKIFIFNPHQISIITFDTQEDYEYNGPVVSLDYRQERIIKVFWHSDSYHLVVLTDKHIQVIESRLNVAPVNLVELSNGDLTAFYDAQADVLYFSDSQKDPRGGFYRNLYKLELNNNLYTLESLVSQSLGQVAPLQKEAH